MTQQETIEALKSAVSPLFWEKALEISPNGRIHINEYGLLYVYQDGKIVHQYTDLPITLESAKAHLRLHEQDWQRANPEMVRQVGWDELKADRTSEVDMWVLHFAGKCLTVWDEKGSFYYEIGMDTSGSYSSLESAKQAAIEALIALLKGEQQ